ncbi:MAG: glycosyltransferase family 9 protein [Acidiferrobacterales bacterium]
MKVLVVRVGRVGDIVMITAALNALLKRYPEAEIHALTSPDGKRVLRGFNDRLTKLIIHDREAFGERFRRPRVRQEIARAGYAHIYCFETKQSFGRLFGGATAQIHQIEQSDELINYAERCLRLVCSQEQEIQSQWIRLPVTDEGRRKALEILRSANVEDDAFLVGIHPTFSGLTKAFFRARQSRQQRGWPLESFAMLARLLTEYAEGKGIRLTTVMDLLPEERPVGERIVHASGNTIKLLTPPPDFERYKAVLERMNLLITPNTGPMHIAGAVGTPMVALFSVLHPGDSGPYIPPQQWVALRSEDTAAPHLGLSAIEPGTVFKACKQYLPA